MHWLEAKIGSQSLELKPGISTWHTGLLTDGPKTHPFLSIFGSQLPESAGAEHTDVQGCVHLLIFPGGTVHDASKPHSQGPNN